MDGVASEYCEISFHSKTSFKISLVDLVVPTFNVTADFKIFSEEEHNELALFVESEQELIPDMISAMSLLFVSSLFTERNRRPFDTLPAESDVSESLVGVFRPLSTGRLPFK